MKKLLIGLVAVGVLLIAAILIAPSFVDWNAHKQEITAMVREATGRELVIRGNIDVTVLPSPALRVEDVRLSSIEGAVSPEMVRLPEARIGFAFAPLLEGRLATVVTLVRPTVNLEKLKDGRVNWDFASKQEAPSTGEQAAGHEGGGLPLDVKLDSFRIVNGTVSYHDASAGTLERLEGLNSEISFDSLRGPFRVDGSARVRGIPFVLRASTGVIKPDSPLFVTAEATTADGASKLRLNGTVSRFDGAPAINGEMEAESKSVAAFAKSIFGTSMPDVFDQPLTLHGNLAGSEKAVSLSAIEIEFGEARASGEITAELSGTPRVTALIRSGNLNLDAFLDGKARAGESAAAPAGGPDAAPKAPAVTQAADAEGAPFALPADLDASLTIAADIIQYNGALVRDMSIKAALKDGRGTIEDMSAVLPGNSYFGVKGDIAAVDGKPDLALRVSGRSDNLREIIEWIGVDIASVPADRLRRFSLEAAVTGSPKNLTAKDIKMQLDSTSVSGGLALVLRDRPAFGLRLVVDRVNLDAYFAGRDSTMQPAPAQAPAAAADKQEPAEPTTAAGIGDALRMLDSFDANIDATVKSLIVARTPATDLRADLTILNGNLDVRHAGIGDLAGLTGSLKGKLDRSKDQPSIDADYTIDVKDPARFARFVDHPALTAYRGNGRLASTGKLVGNVDRMVVNARVEALGVAAAVDGAATALLADPEFKLATSVRSPELVQLVRLGIEDYSPAAGKLGPVDLSFQLEGSRNGIKVDAINGHAGPVALRGSGELMLGAPRPKLRAAISTSEVSLDLFLPPDSRRRSEAPASGFRIIPAAAGATSAQAPSRWSADPIDISALESYDADVAVDMDALTKDPYRLKDAKLRVRLDEGKLTLEQFHANFSSGTMAVTGFLASEQRKVAAALKINLDNVEASELVEALRNYQVRLGPVRFGAKVRGPVTLAATLNTLGSSERDLVTGLTGSGRITGQLNTDTSSETRQVGAVAGLAGALLGSKVKEIRGITDAVQGTDQIVSAFSGPSTLNGDIAIERGVATTRNLVLVGRGGRALTAATANLPQWTLDSVTDITLGQDSDPYLSAQVAGALDDPYVRKVSGTLLRGRPVTPQAEGQAQPGAKAVEPEQPSPAPPGAKKVKPEDVLKDLLQGLGR